MKKFGICLMALFFVCALITAGCAANDDLNKAVDAAKAKFDQAKNAYIAAKKSLSGAQIESLMTIGKAEKQEAVRAVWDARKNVKKTKEVYKAALSELRQAEIAKDAARDRSPWR